MFLRFDELIIANTDCDFQKMSLVWAMNNAVKIAYFPKYLF